MEYLIFKQNTSHSVLRLQTLSVRTLIKYCPLSLTILLSALVGTRPVPFDTFLLQELYLPIKNQLRKSKKIYTMKVDRELLSFKPKAC
jgi:hypothetical protein